MAAGEGPRDWRPDERRTYSSGLGGRGGNSRSRLIEPRPPLRWGLIVAAIAAVLVAVVAGIASGVSSTGNASPVHPMFNQSQGFQPRPVPNATEGAGAGELGYSTPGDERSAMLSSLPIIAGALLEINNSGERMPAAFTVTDGGTLLAEPSGRALGTLPHGCTVSWVDDAEGRATTLMLIGPSFGTRIPLDVSAFWTHRPATAKHSPTPVRAVAKHPPGRR